MFYITFTSLLFRFRRRRWHRTNHVIFFIFVAVLSSVQTTFSAPFVRHFESVTESYWSETNAFEVCASADRCSLGKFVYLYFTSANFLIDDWTESEILGVLQGGDLSTFTLPGLRFYFCPGKSSFNSPWIVIGKGGTRCDNRRTELKLMEEISACHVEARISVSCPPMFLTI